MAQKIVVTPDGLKLPEEDIKFFNDKPSPKFSSGDLKTRNQRVINHTITKYKAQLAAKKRKFDTDLGERTDALAHYFKYLAHGGFDPADKYFGRKELARLQGRRIVSQIFKTAKGEKGAHLSEADDIIS